MSEVEEVFAGGGDLPALELGIKTEERRVCSAEFHSLEDAVLVLAGLKERREERRGNREGIMERREEKTNIGSWTVLCG